MIKILKLILLVWIATLVVFISTKIAFNKYVEHKHIPLKILYSVVSVGNASGVIVYSDEVFTLVLTAFHVLDFSDKAQAVGVLYLNETKEFTFETFPILDLEVEPENDLALLVLPPIKNMGFIKLVGANDEPITGDDIYVAANPNLRFRSIRKGTLSSKLRLDSKDIRMWEVSGGVIFGSSGGGAFTMDGELFGVITGVDMLITNFCKEERTQCLGIPLTDAGFVIPPDTIREFVLNSNFDFCFNYLRE